EPRSGEGIQQFRHRAYDPRSARWLQEDPIGLSGGSLSRAAQRRRDHLYRYNNGNPVRYSDPYGMLADGAGAECDHREVATSDTTKTCRTALQKAADASAGFGDFVSFGATRFVREWWSCGDCVN